MKMLRSTLRALIEAELAELGPKMTRLGGRYGGEPDFAIADPGNKDVPNPVVQTSKKGGKNESIRRPVTEVESIEGGSATCKHRWEEQPGEPPRDVCPKCGAVRY